MTSTDVDGLILGAGVGGAMLTLALGRAGVSVLLAEPGSDIPSRGAEILKPRGIRVLRDCGVPPGLLRHGTCAATTTTDNRCWSSTSRSIASLATS